jgi:TetR/AcrR family acrAB operon transcriptional repressor
MAGELEFPTKEIIADLPPTAARLVIAAQELLREKGFRGLTLEAITERAGENKASVRYYFGNKEGLLAAVVDSLTPREAVAEMVARADGLVPGRERVHEYLHGMKGLTDDMASFRALFDMLPHVLQQTHLRDQVAELYAWYRDLNCRMLGAGATASDRRQLKSVGSLVTAAVDGLALQALLDPDGFDLDSAFSALEELVAQYLDRREPAEVPSHGAGIDESPAS